VIVQLLLNGLIVGSVYSLIAIGLALTYRTCGFFNLAHAAVFAVAPYAAYAVLVHAHGASWLALVTGVLSAILVGSLCYRGVYQPLRQRRADPLVLFLASLGLFVVIEGGLGLFFGFEARSLPQEHIAAGVGVVGARITVIQMITLASVLGIVSCWCLALARTDYGLLLRAIASDYNLAKISGVQTDRVTHIGFIASSFAAGIGGLLQGYDTGLTPAMGFGGILVGIIAVVIGGGSAVLSAVAAMLLGVLQQVVVCFLPTQWQDASVFVVLMVALLLKPKKAIGDTEKRKAV